MGPYEIGLLVGIVVLLVLSGLFSAAETSFSAANVVRLRTMEADGNKRASKMLKKLNNADRVLSAVLIGNNVMNITASSLSTLLFLSLLKNNTGLAATLSTVVLTFLLVVFCEITPKIIAKENPEKVGMSLYPFVAAVMVILFPFTWLFSQWKKLIKKMFKLKNTDKITEDELITFVETAANEGGIEKHESKLIKSAIEFEDVNVEDIMVPRVQVVGVSEDDSLESIEEKFREHEFSRMPVYSGTVDSIIGILHEKDFQKFCLKNKASVKDVLSHSACVPGNMKISTVLKILQKSKVHMAVVVDEFGGTSGIITLEDILEELVGEIFDEHDEEIELIKQTAEGVYTVSGSAGLDDMFEALEIPLDNDKFNSATVGGFVTELLGRIPKIGEKAQFDRLLIEVTKANNRRVLEVKITVNDDESPKDKD